MAAFGTGINLDQNYCYYSKQLLQLHFDNILKRYGQKDEILSKQAIWIYSANYANIGW